MGLKRVEVKVEGPVWVEVEGGRISMSRAMGKVCLGEDGG